MPQLGETVTEGTIIRWLKKVGDEVAHDEPLFEVSTDKVDSDVPSPISGYLAEILVPEGATVDVGTKLAVVTEEAPSGAGAPPPAAPPAAATPPAPAAVAPPPASPPAPAAAAPPAPPPAAAPPAPPAATPTVPAPVGASLASPPAAPPAGGTQAPAQAPVATATEADGAESNGEGLVLSPVVRRLVVEHGIDPSSIPGSGKGGRITRGDVLSFIDQNAAGGAPASTAAPAPASPAAPELARVAPASRPQGRPARPEGRRAPSEALQVPPQGRRARRSPPRTRTHLAPERATRSCLLRTSDGSPPSTWSGRRRLPLTPLL